MALKDLILKYEDLRARKDELAEETKTNNAAIEEVKQKIADQMIEDDTPTIGVGDYTYSLQASIKYSFKSEAALAGAGINKMDVLRENGYGYLITERVDPRTLNSAMKEAAESDAGIPEEIEEILTQYEYQDIGRRKSTSKALKIAKGE